MSRKIFVLLIICMGIALIGIIAVQIYWIKSTVEVKEEQFSTSVKYALAKVSENIQKREFTDDVTRFAPILDSLTKLEERGVKDFFYQQIDTSRNEIFTYRQRVLENSYRTQISPLEDDSFDFKTILSEQETEVKSLEFKSKDFAELSPEERIVKVGKLDKYDKLVLEEYFDAINARVPITDRISNNEVRLNLDNELRIRNINTPFEYAVFSEDLITRVKSDNFEMSNGGSYEVPLFIDNEGFSDYKLFVSFPDKKGYILSTITNNLLLAALFILAIIFVFASSLYQMLKQKKISEIKTDFINNMTHEFKTPIATINLAIDAINNPKIINDQDKVKRYAEMIREENKRMHAQVENVLRISKLEKNQLDITKSVLDIHDIIDDALKHVNLIVINKEGKINKEFKATRSEVLASKFHFTNVFINILDNAIKYSTNAPIIDVVTENVGNFILIRISDNGIGMNRNVQKKIFDKFYREQSGNIHDVKGHGLGLAYVKSITNLHQGAVFVESEKGKGSTFTIKLPLI
ncbi:MAG: HAMP domain-containing sensor histidine kinase [Lutimonas sp.]